MLKIDVSLQDKYIIISVTFYPLLFVRRRISPKIWRQKKCNGHIVRRELAPKIIGTGKPKTENRSVAIGSGGHCICIIRRRRPVGGSYVLAIQRSKSHCNLCNLARSKCLALQPNARSCLLRSRNYFPLHVVTCRYMSLHVVTCRYMSVTDRFLTVF